MGETLAGGRYAVTWRNDTWVVRAPDGRTVKAYGHDDRGRAEANLRAERLNQKLRTIDRK